jgi:alkaline phosphatase D
VARVQESSEVVGNAFVPAPHGLRLGAWVIDCLIVGIVFAALPQPLPLILPLLLLVVYHTVLLWLTQQTVGKALLGLRVRRIGREPDLMWAIGRSTVGYFAIDLFGIGILTALFNRDHRALHDLTFDSLVTMDQTGPFTARTLVSRFVAFCERQSAAVNARKKVVGVAGALWAFLLGLGRALKVGVDYVTRALGVRDDAQPSSSILQKLSAKTATMAMTAATVATGAVFAAVPPARALAEWLLEPRYFIGGPDPVTSSFDTDAEGWKVFGDAQGASDDPTYDVGALRATDDQSGGTWYWQAPASFLGNKLSLHERDLLFRLKVDNTQSPYDDDDIVLAGDEVTLVYDLPESPATEWTSYRIRLDESAAWINRSTKTRATREEVRRVLADVRQLLVRGEFRVGGDTGWLDEVVFGAEPLARIVRVEVPESITSGSPRARLTVTYAGEPRFPVQLIYRARSCPSGYNCLTERSEITSPPADRRLAGEGFVWCQMTGAVWNMDWEIVIRDREGTEIARPAPVVCVPTSP